MEEESQESQRRFRELAESLPQLVWTCRADGLCDYLSPQWLNYTGIPKEKQLGYGWLEQVYPDDREPTVTAWNRAVETDSNLDIEFRLRRKDGVYRWFKTCAVPYRDEEGKIVKWFGTNTDINDQRQSEEALRKSQEQFAGIISSAMDAIITIDEEQKIILFNAAAEKMFLCSSNEAMGEPVTRFIPERFRSTHKSHIENFGQTKVTKRSMGSLGAIFGLRSDGEEFPIEASISQFESEGKSFYTVILRDITERERAEKRFHQVIEGTPNGMVMVDKEGKIVLVNAQIEKTFGYNRDELLGQSIEMLVPQRFHAHHPNYRNNFISAPTVRPMGAGRDLYGLRKDGSEFPVEIGLNPIETEQGIMVLGTIVDITERKLAEEALRKSQEQLAGIISSAMDAIITIDEEQKIILFNAAAEKMFLCSSNEAMGEPVTRFIPERFRSTHKSHIENFGQTKVTKRSMGSLGAIFGLRSDGEEFPIEASISQLESEGKKFYTVILRDITEREQVGTKLREQTQILDLAPVLILDLNQRIVFWNTGAEMMYGWKQEEIIGELSHNLLQTEFPTSLEEIRNFFLANGFWEGELIHTKKDGERIVVASQWVLHKNENGEPKAILEINTDITERRQAQEQIQRLNEELELRVVERTKQLETANKELEAFSYSVSHDLRAPLRAINGYSQALSEDYEDIIDDEGKNFLQEIRNASKDMAQLIDDMLQLARVSRSEIRNEQINLSDMVNAIVNQLQKNNPDHKVTIKIEAGLMAKGDQRLLKVMLSNLLENAWKFTSKRENAEIIFGHEIKDGETVYFVRDNGVGFDMEYADKLFGVFQRLHSVGEFEGTGVGLATVQRILNRHGGRVWAEGKVNHGATFYFTLPIIE